MKTKGGLSSVINDSFIVIKEQALASRVSGSFLLSVAEMSDFWIDINEFNNPTSMDALTTITTGYLEVLSNKYQPLNVIIPYYNTSSEKIFPLKTIVEKAAAKCPNPINIVNMYVDSEKIVHFIDSEIKGDNCIIFMSVSVHIYSMIDIINAIQGMRKNIVCALTFLCREKISIELLQEKSIPLIPYLVCLSGTDSIYNSFDLLSDCMGYQDQFDINSIKELSLLSC